MPESGTVLRPSRMRLLALLAWQGINYMWWLGLFCLPFVPGLLAERLYRELGCTGDCYVPGTEAAFLLDHAMLPLCLLLWPPSLWFLGVRRIFRR